MTTAPLREQLQEALRELAEASDPKARLHIAQRMRALADELEHAEVLAAREQGMSWSKIGVIYGLTKQGAQQRFRKDDAKPATEVTP